MILRITVRLSQTILCILPDNATLTQTTLSVAYSVEYGATVAQDVSVAEETDEVEDVVDRAANSTRNEKTGVQATSAVADPATSSAATLAQNHPASDDVLPDADTIRDSTRTAPVERPMGARAFAMSHMTCHDTDDSFSHVIRNHVQGFLDSFEPDRVGAVTGGDEEDEVGVERRPSDDSETLDQSTDSVELVDRFYFGTSCADTANSGDNPSQLKTDEAAAGTTLSDGGDKDDHAGSDVIVTSSESSHGVVSVVAADVSNSVAETPARDDRVTAGNSEETGISDAGNSEMRDDVGTGAEKNGCTVDMEIPTDDDFRISRHCELPDELLVVPLPMRKATVERQVESAQSLMNISVDELALETPPTQVQVTAEVTDKVEIADGHNENANRKQTDEVVIDNNGDTDDRISSDVIVTSSETGDVVDDRAQKDAQDDASTPDAACDTSHNDKPEIESPAAEHSESKMRDKVKSEMVDCEGAGTTLSAYHSLELSSPMQRSETESDEIQRRNLTDVDFTADRRHGDERHRHPAVNNEHSTLTGIHSGDTNRASVSGDHSDASATSVAAVGDSRSSTSTRIDPAEQQTSVTPKQQPRPHERERPARRMRTKSVETEEQLEEFSSTVETVQFARASELARHFERLSAAAAAAAASNPTSRSSSFSCSASSPFGQVLTVAGDTTTATNKPSTTTTASTAHTTTTSTTTTVDTATTIVNIHAVTTAAQTTTTSAAGTTTSTSMTTDTDTPATTTEDTTTNTTKTVETSTFTAAGKVDGPATTTKDMSTTTATTATTTTAETTTTASVAGRMVTKNERRDTVQQKKPADVTDVYTVIKSSKFRSHLTDGAAHGSMSATEPVAPRHGLQFVQRTKSVVLVAQSGGGGRQENGNVEKSRENRETARSENRPTGSTRLFADSHNVVDQRQRVGVTTQGGTDSEGTKGSSQETVYQDTSEADDDVGVSASRSSVTTTPIQIEGSTEQPGGELGLSSGTTKEAPGGDKERLQLEKTESSPAATTTTKTPRDNEPVEQLNEASNEPVVRTLQATTTRIAEDNNNTEKPLEKTGKGPAVTTTRTTTTETAGYNKSVENVKEANNEQVVVERIQTTTTKKSGDDKVVEGLNNTGSESAVTTTPTTTTKTPRDDNKEERAEAFADNSPTTTTRGADDAADELSRVRAGLRSRSARHNSTSRHFTGAAGNKPITR